jgi:uncharacterized 2Fe-2S/4Fe-4S cluster protein (DUF4445 family)
VVIEEGFFTKFSITSKMENLTPFLTKEEGKHIDDTHKEKGYRLACAAYLKGDVLAFVPEEARAGKQLVRKKARDIHIEHHPAVRKYYVECPPATLEDPIGDLERLKAELLRTYELQNLDIDFFALRTLPDAIREQDWKLTVSVWNDREIIRVEPGDTRKVCWGMAVDEGTTTVAAYLCNLVTGQLVATGSMMNPQVQYGEDVMARITYCMQEKEDNIGLKRLFDCIIEGFNTVLEATMQEVDAHIEDIMDMTLVGNTAMHHIALGIYPESMAMCPFPPTLHKTINVKARDLGINLFKGAYIHVLPIQAGFVGADNTGVLICEEPYHKDEMQLIIDVGTNGELLLGNKEKVISSSCATGPALEGAQIKFGMRASPGAIQKITISDKFEVNYNMVGVEIWNKDGEEIPEDQEIRAKGICGSGIIDVIAQMFKSNVLKKNGAFNRDIDTPRLRKDEEDKDEFVIVWAKDTSIGKDIVINIGDVRAVQLAKGAICSGAQIMMRTLGVDKIDKVVLAGAFGSYIDPESALIIGMVPSVPLDKISSVGNAAGDGARKALLDTATREEAERKAREVEYIELTLALDFDSVFGRAMHFPHMKDPYPALVPLIGEERANMKKKK